MPQEKNDSSTTPDRRHHLCEACKWWEYGAVCSHEKLQPVGFYGKIPEDGARDGENCLGILTGPKFGCIHYEKKGEHRVGIGKDSESGSRRE